MPDQEDHQRARPPLVFRVGITGARSLNQAQLTRINRELAEVLQFVKVELARLAQENAVQAGYACSAPNVLDPALLFVSPLARGADRLAARSAVDLGYRLCVPMPFAIAEYEKDFTGSSEDKPNEVRITADEDVAEFRSLLAHASSQIELDGARGGDANPFERKLEGLSYEAVGRYVVRHCDLLIAVWDGEPVAGRGGTAEIVEYAARVNVPIWWIQATKNEDPAWLVDQQDLRDPIPAENPPVESLRMHLERLVRPPFAPAERPHNLIERLFRKRRRGLVSYANIYLEEQPLPPRHIWNAYGQVMHWVGGQHSSGDAEAPAGYWFDYYNTADTLATGYAARYRSCYVLIIAFTSLALLFGALAPGFTKRPHFEYATLVLSVLELFMLAAIILLLGAYERGEWHRRSIEYRMLAELFRKQQTLAPLGWAVPVASVQHMATKEWMWIAWLFAAAQRAAPLPQLQKIRVEQNELNRSGLMALIDQQLKYHREREKAAHRAAERLEKLGTGIFVVVLGIVLLKLPAELKSWNPDLILLLRFGATTLPAISAAFVALRSYSELQLLFEQSNHMIAELERASIRVQRLCLTRPLVSQDLGAEAAAVTSVMLEDLHGWGQLFRGKLVEAS